MKNPSKTLMLASALCLALVGCGQPYPTVPEEDAEAFEEAVEQDAGQGEASEAEGAEATESGASAEVDDPALDSSGFVELSEAVPDVMLEPRYYGTYNFVGERIEGYEEPVILVTRETAEALQGASDDLEAQGYRLLVYDGYRPQTAVNDFMAWAEDPDATEMKAYFYPEEPKETLFDKGYIAKKSGHSRGSTLDLTIFDMSTGEPVDMGGAFDYFGEKSHPDYTEGLTQEQIANRKVLADAMTSNGFEPLDTEWWHFTLADEPYPDTYFDFPVASLD